MIEQLDFTTNKAIGKIQIENSEGFVCEYFILEVKNKVEIVSKQSSLGTHSVVANGNNIASAMMDFARYSSKFIQG